MIDDQPKLVFISYSRVKLDQVRPIVDRLIGDGVKVLFDVYDLKQGNHLIPYMEQSVNNPDVDYVLVFCDKSYTEKANGRKGGVGIESTILSQEVYNKVDQEKVVPIVIENDDGVPCIPTFLKDIYHIDFTKPDFEKQYESLLRLIYKRPEYRRPKLGKPPAWIDDESVDYSTIRTLLASSNPVDRVSEYALYQEVSEVLISLIQSDFSDGPSYKAIIDREKICRDLIVDYFINRLRKNDPVGHAMGKLLEHLDNSLLFVTDQSRQNLADYFKWELAIVFSAVLLKYEKYEELSNLVGMTFFVKTGESMRPYSFFHFDYFCPIIQDVLMKQLELNKISMQAHLLVSRLYVPYFDSNDLASADLVLYHISSLMGGEDWFPRAYVYLDGVIEVWAKMQSCTHCTKLLNLLGVDNVESLKALISSTKNPELGYSMTYRDAPWILEYIQADKIGKVR